MTPQATASITEALNVIENEPDRRERLWDNIRYFKKNLENLGFSLGNSETAIFPVIIGDELKVREMCRYLHDADIYVNPCSVSCSTKEAFKNQNEPDVRPH